jgi:Protein of unknown function (DUF3768)
MSRDMENEEQNTPANTDEVTRIEKERRAATAVLNDLARTAMGVACRLAVTQGFSELPHADQSRVRELVETYDVWGDDNDPYFERDFGVIYHARGTGWTTAKPANDDIMERVLWKIDYYDLALKWGSEAPWNSAVTARVLTIMLGSEY